MARKRRSKKRAELPYTFTPPPEASGDELVISHELLQSLAHHAPDLVQNMREGWLSWLEEFLAENGREPTEEEFVTAMLGEMEADGTLDELENLLGDDLATELNLGLEDEEDAAAVRYDLGFGRDPGEWGPDPSVEPWLVVQHCAWCGDSLDHGHEVCTFGIKLRFHPDQEDEEPVVFYLPLITHQRLLPALLTGKGTEARADGWDLVVATCGDACSTLARSALTHDHELASRLLFN